MAQNRGVERSKGGRPAKPPEERKIPVSFSMTRADLADLRALAAHWSLVPGALIVRLVRAALARERRKNKGDQGT